MSKAAAKPAETPAAAPAAKSAGNDNMALWNRLFQTDPSATKPFNRAGGFKGTAIKPFWCIKRATEEFGPVGQGWGWTEHEHMTYTHTDGRAIWFSRVSIWYMRGEQQFETGPQWGATELVAKRTSGDFLDEEAAKKAVTDGITKCLSYLGLAGDVHMGLFDDSKYVSEQRDREEKEHRGVKVSPETVQLWRDAAVANAKAATTSEGLKKVWEAEKATWKTYAASEDAATKNAANYVKSQVERRAAELKQDGAAEAPQGHDPETGEVNETAAAAE